MRYNSTQDGQYLRQRSMGPVAAASRRQYAMPIPGRGQSAILQGQTSRMSLRGFGATGLGPPTGAGAGAGAAIGASQGASIGSAIVPGIGTAIGAVVGAIGGAIAGAINKKDPEQHNFDQAVALWQQNPAQVYSIGNPYLALAGLFDLNIKTNIPIYKKFGHMGEAAFVVWLCNTVYQAAQSGVITPNDTALTVMSKVVQPQIDSWGYGPMSDPHADLIQRLIVTMILQYCAGAQTNWYAIGGDYPTQFRSLPAFAFPNAPSVTASPTPSPMPTSTTATSPTLSPSGSYLMHDIAGTMVTAQGTWTSNAQGQMFWNGNLAALSPKATGAAGTLAVAYVSGVVYAYNNDGSSYYWNTTSGWIATTTAPNPPAQIGWTSAAAAAALAAQQAQQAAGTAAAQAAAQAAATAAAQAAATAAAAQNTTQTSTAQSTTTQTTVSTTPPAIGGALTYAKDNATGKMVALPAGGTYAGLTTTGGWLVNYVGISGVPDGVYESNNGVLSLFGGASTPGAIPAGYSQTTQSVLLNGQAYPLYADSTGNLYVWTGGNMIPYTANTAAQTAAQATTTSVGGGGGGGGGGYYSAPATSTAQDMSSMPLTSPDSGGSSWLWIGAAAAAVFLAQSL